MRKTLNLILIVSVLVLIPSLALARGWHHRQQPPIQQVSNMANLPNSNISTPPAGNVSTPPLPPTASNLQVGFFQPPSNIPSPWTMEFTDGAFPSGSGNLVIFLEPPYNDASVIVGKFDSTLTVFAQNAAKYPNQIILALGEEVNCDQTDPWGGAFPGNTVASTIAAFQHEATLVRSLDSNIKIAFSTNNDSCYGQPAATVYYPGANFVDVSGVDGFDFGGQTWDSVFDHAIQPLQSLGKPIWVLSEGVTSQDNQSQFIADSVTGAAKYQLGGILYFNQSPFNAAASTLQQL